MKKFVAVAGNIGVGKSSLVARLSERLGWQPFYEAVAENPYLPDFYRDMQTWSFHSQVFFLSNRLRTHRQLLDHPTSVVQDRSVYEDAEVFACNLYRQGHLDERDYKTYRQLYEILVQFLPPPDLVVYLRASVSTLQARVSLRGRDYERRIAPEYLAQLNGLYDEWIQAFSLCPVLTVPADDLDYVTNSAHLDLIVQKVVEKLQGKEEVSF
jgi:deoxyadenosine/deoxycytidine kinase